MLLIAVMGLLGAACTDSDSSSSDEGGSSGANGSVDPTEVGLWDDGPCDESLEPLVVGIQATFESPVLTAKDSAAALEVSALKFNERGGANDHCIEVFTCDEKADANKAVECARQLERDGVSVTINDGSVAPGPEVGQTHADNGIPRFFINAGTPDLSDLNAFPFDAGGIGTTMVMPQALVDQGAKKIASIRVDIAAAAALIGIYEDIYSPEGVEFVADIPVPTGTTDYSQFILSAEEAGADGIMIALGGQEAIQVLRAAQQLGSDLPFSTSLGTLSYNSLQELGDFAQQVTLNGANAPTTADVPVLPVLRDDLSESDEDLLQPENLKTTPMHSWMGLYALLSIIRSADTEDFSRENMTALIKESGPLDMLDLTAEWTPDTVNPGAFPRTGNGYYAFWKWDPEAEFDGNPGNLVKSSELDFNELICGTPIGAPADTC